MKFKLTIPDENKEVAINVTDLSWLKKSTVPMVECLSILGEFLEGAKITDETDVNQAVNEALDYAIKETPDIIKKPLLMAIAKNLNEE